MKKAILLFTLIISAFLGRTQNLVPNGDFEGYSSCPTWTSQFDTLLFWFNPTVASPDYYNQCSSSIGVGVPDNWCGYQPALSGFGYSGLHPFVLGNPGAGWREYLEVLLLAPLSINQCYHFEMYINLANNSRYTTDDIGVYFSDTLITDYSTTSILQFNSQINNATGNFPDTLNWNLVSGNYTAHGGENYIIIGNFKDSANTDTIMVNSNSTWWAYIFIDDVCLTPCGSLCTTGLNSPPQKESISIYPNPTHDILNISLNNSYTPITISITDIIGKQIFTTHTTTLNFKLKTLNYPAGIYFVKVITDNETLVQKFVKE